MGLLFPEIGEFIEVIPPMKRIHDDWYLGTADAVYQNIESIHAENAEITMILSGDHIYKMDYFEMVAWHQRNNADVTIATIQMPPEAPTLWHARIEADFTVSGFEEKPQHGNPTRSVFNYDMVSRPWAYTSSRRSLLQALIRDAEDENSAHDFGKNILPALIGRVEGDRLRFPRSQRQDRSLLARRRHPRCILRRQYGSRVGDSGVQSVRPPLALGTRMSQAPPAKFVFAQRGPAHGCGDRFIVSHGCIISGGRLTRSVLSPGVRVNSYCESIAQFSWSGSRWAATAGFTARSSHPGLSCLKTPT